MIESNSFVESLYKKRYNKVVVMIRGGKSMLLGSHVSMSGKKMLLGSAEEAASYGASTFMIYTGAPQNTRRKAVEEMNIPAGQDVGCCFWLSFCWKGIYY